MSPFFSVDTLLLPWEYSIKSCYLLYLHNSSNKESFIAKLRHNDDRESCEEAVEEPVIWQVGSNLCQLFSILRFLHQIINQLNISEFSNKLNTNNFILFIKNLKDHHLKYFFSNMYLIIFINSLLTYTRTLIRLFSVEKSFK